MDTQDDPFLTALRAAPADRTTRLVYADWLEERNDPRSELVRVCEAMRDEPVWSDRYWQLKARRNERWDRVPLDWLEATGYDGGFYDPVFRDGVPDEPRERWRLIREFTERWHGIAVPDVGGRREEVEAAEHRLGLELPPSVQEFVAYAHDLGELGTPAADPRRHFSLFHGAYCRIDHLSVFRAVRLIHYTLGGGRVLGVAPEDLENPDPPTYAFSEQISDDVDFDEDGRPTFRFEDPVLSAPTLSQSIFAHLFTELPSAGEMGTIWPNPDEFLDRLGADFPIRARFDDADVFESDEVLVFVGGSRSWSGSLHGRSVQALVRRPVPIASVPAYLFGTDDRHTSSSGMLGPEWFRQQQEEEARRPGYRPPPRWASVLRRREAEAAGRDPWGNPFPPPPGSGPQFNDGDEIPF